MFNWSDVITDAVSRLDWVAGQSSDPGVQSMLLQTAGSGEPTENAPIPDAVRAERRKAITRERMARLLGQRKDNRWAGRETGKGGGVFNPADITPEQAAALLVVVRRYVARWSHPTARYPLSQEGQDDTVSRIIHAIWARDYTRSNVTAGNLAGATWQACALYRKTAWVGESALERKEARRRLKREPMPDDMMGHRRGGIDNPARIAMAIEAAAAGLAAPAVVNRGRKQTRRQRGYKRMEPVAAAVARAVLCGE